MRKTKSFLAFVLALMMVLQLVPAVGADEAVQVNAAYTANAAAISAAATGYYWDAANVYYADGTQVNAYSLKDLGVNLTDYNQVHTVNIGGNDVAIKFCPAVTEYAALDSTNIQTANYSFNTNVSGDVVTFSNMEADTTITDTSKTPLIGSAVTNHSTAYDRSVPLMMSQTLQIDALPATGRLHQSFVGNKPYAYGFSSFLFARDVTSGDPYIMQITIQKDAQGNLILYVNNGGQYSAGVSATVNLDVKLGETFDLDVLLNPDNSAAIYINGVQVGSVAAYALGDNNCCVRKIGAEFPRGISFGVRYAEPDASVIAAGDGDVKFTVSNMRVTSPKIASVAQDTATKSFSDLIDALDVSAVVTDANLPTQVQYTSGAMPIYWTSSNAAVLSDEGKVVSAPAVPTDVTMTATCAGETATVTVTVVPDPWSEPVEALYAFPTEKNLIKTFAESATAGTYTLSAADCSSSNAAYIMGYLRSGLINHSTYDLVLDNVITINKFPEGAYNYTGGTTGNGLLIIMGDRVDGVGTNCRSMLASIVNVGGALKLHIGNSAAIDLGKGLGESFRLTIEWNKDDSAYVYVDQKCKAILHDATTTTNWLSNCNVQYYCTTAGTIDLSVADMTVYRGINSVRGALAELSVTDVLSGIYTDTITGDLPTTYTVDGNVLNVAWIGDGITQDGDVTLGQTERAITLGAVVEGVSVKSAEMTVKAAGTIDVDALEGINHVAYMTMDDAVNKNIVQNMTVEGNVMAFDNTPSIERVGLISSNQMVYKVDHAKYDMLLVQQMQFDALAENPNGLDVFSGSTAKGYYFFINDRYNHSAADYTKYDNGDEHMMLATIQNEGGELVLYVANGDKTTTAARVGMRLGKGLGEKFTLSTLWAKDDSLTVYVDGVEVGTLTGCVRNVSYRGADCMNFGYVGGEAGLRRNAIFTTTATLYSFGDQAQLGDVIYANVKDAIAAAEAGENKVVTLIDDVVVDELAIPAGVSLDLNGKAITVNKLASFGDVYDSSAESAGRIYTDGDVELSADNSQMAIYHCEQGFYLLTDMGAQSLGTKASANGIAFGFNPALATNYANHMLSKQENEGRYTGLTATITLTWTGNDTPVAYVISDDMMREYGDKTFTYAPYGIVMALVLNVSGVDALSVGDQVIVDLNLASETGVVVDFDDIVYEIIE